MNNFTTKLDTALQWREMLIVNIVFLVGLSLLNLFSLRTPGGVIMFVIFEVAILFSGFVALIFWYPRTKPVFFHFEGNKLYIDGPTAKAHFVVWDIPASDFILTQSKAEKAKNCGTMKIKNTIFNYKGVMYFEEMKEYIERNF